MRNLGENQTLFQILLIKVNRDMFFFSFNKIYFHNPQNNFSFKKYLTDIPRQREEYEVIYGTRRNAECHITSILRAEVEYLFYFMTNSRYIFVTK